MPAKGDNMEGTQQKGVKLLHIGDVFLDCPFSVMTARDSAARRRETRDTFLRVIRYVQEQEINVLLITGNLIDNIYATLDTLELLRAAFASIPACRVYITPGSHDFIGENSIYTLGKLPANVHVFDQAAPTRVVDEESRLAVIGWAFTDHTYAGSPLADHHAEPYFDGVTLVAGYATLDGEEGQAPISIISVGEFGGDYTALSGGNLFDGFHRVNTATFAYSGALEHSCYEEPGFGGANLVTIVPGNLGSAPHIETARVEFGSRRYAAEAFDITDVTSPNEVLSRITSVITERGYGRETALKVVLTGRVPIGFTVPPMTNEHFGLYAFDLDDRTIPSFDESRLARDMTVRGEVCRTLLRTLKNGTEEEQRIAAAALRIAIAALENRDVDKL